MNKTLYCRGDPRQESLVKSCGSTASASTATGLGVVVRVRPVATTIWTPRCLRT